MARRKQQNAVTIKGFVRFALRDIKTGQITESPWYENVITAKGFEEYIVRTAGAVSGSKTAGWLALGTQSSAPSSTQTSVLGEFGGRKASTNTFVANGTLQMTASWASSEATESSPINAIAVYNASTAGAGTAGSIAQVTASTKTSQQTLNVTYEWRFS